MVHCHQGGLGYIVIRGAKGTLSSGGLRVHCHQGGLWYIVIRVA